jgi:hypothetical protein
LKVEFRDAIAVAIPLFTEVLKHDDENVRFSAVSTLDMLAENGEWQSHTIAM